tara:strand:- start:32860 stop:33990 length:1131 start_codon:yes stop_codon:yes gene_type:complete
MKIKYVSIVLFIISLISFSSFSQTENEEPLLGLPGDDLDLYAVLNLFQKSKTIEDFEKSLNAEKAGIVNLDLNNDGNVDFIKVVTQKEGDDFLFILQDPISEKETQDVAVMTVSKDADGKVTMQIIGDEELYGKNYVVEPVTEATPSVTSNPAYAGADPVTVNVEATTEVIVVQSAPVVQYVYSPVYVPYAPPYYYGYYPPYWVPFAVVGISIYRHNHYYHHHGYHGGYGHTSVNINVHNHNSYNNYNKNIRNSSLTVNNNIKSGNFKTSGQKGSRPSTRQKGKVSNGSKSSNRGSKSQSKSQLGKASKASSNSNRFSTGQSKYNKSKSSSSSNRSASPRTSNRSSGSRSMGSSHSSGAGRSFGGRSGGGGGGRRR